MSESRSDFGKILDQWENSNSEPGRLEETESGTAGKALEGWLDRYPPPDKDRETDGGAHAPRRNPAKMKVEAQIDLHGLTLDEAIMRTGGFVEESIQAGHRKILVIHGKGDNGEGVLRREVRAFLEKHPQTGTMGYNRGADGGRGALWVILRQGSRES